MGTKADFYIGVGSNSIWLGSIAWNGQPSQIAKLLSSQDNELDYLNKVRGFLKDRPDATSNESGSNHWPWPWDDSRNTHFSYTYHDNQIQVSHFGGIWCNLFDHTGQEFPRFPLVEFPDMSDRRLSIIGEKSGIVIITDKSSLVEHGSEST